MIAEYPLWHDGTVMPQTGSALERCDVLIAGGGITGLAAGIGLLEAGASVMVLDTMQPGQGASGRAFGSIALGSSSTLAALCSRHGRLQGERLWREASDAAAQFADYIALQGLDADYRRSGHLRLAVAASHEAGLRADHDAWRRVLGDEHIHLVSGDALRSALPGQQFRLGLLDQATATIDPYRYVASLLQRFNALGGSYVAGCAASAIVRSGDGFVTTHQAGKSYSREVIHATNGHTGTLVPWLRRRIFSVGSYMIATAPLPAELRAAFDPRRRVHTTAYNLKNYFRLDADGRLIFGGRANLSAGIASAAIAAELRDAMLRYFPMLEPVPLTHVWGGMLGFTFDGMPHIGSHRGMHYALGYCGRGLPMATLFGQQLARAIGGAGMNSLHAGVKMPARWYYRRRPWFLPIAAAYYRWQDRKAA